MKHRNAVLLLSAVICLSSCNRNNSGGNVEENTQTRAAWVSLRAKPATVEVIAMFTVDGSIPDWELNTDRLKVQLTTLAKPGESKHDLVMKIMNLFLSDPAEYLSEGTGEKKEFKRTLTSAGTGFIVTPDGYILTNAHVVKPDMEQYENVLKEELAEFVKADVLDIEKGFESEAGEAIDDTRRDRLIKALVEFDLKNLNLHKTENFAVIMPSESGGSASSSSSIHCEVKVTGDPSPGRDVAVLKIEGSDLPTLPLAPVGAEVPTGSNLVIYGYPGKVAFDPNFTESSRMQPTMTKGIVSGTKEMAGGWKVIQTDATLNHGNSGGPAMNDAGEVVGLATFAETESQGLNFAISIDVARQFLENLGVRPHESEFTEAYNQALDEYSLPGHGKALALFTDLHNSHTENGTVSQFVHELSREQAHPTNNHEGDREPDHGGRAEPEPVHHGGGPLPIFFIMIGVVLVGGLLIVIATTRR